MCYRQVTYCSPECQKKDWKEHKKTCKPEKVTSVVLSKPPSSGYIDPRHVLQNNRNGTSEYGRYQLPTGVVPGEKFWMKIQLGKGPLFLHDKSQTCSFLYNPGHASFTALREKVRAEKAFVGRKAYFKSSFGEDGNCTIYLNETALKNW